MKELVTQTITILSSGAPLVVIIMLLFIAILNNEPLKGVFYILGIVITGVIAMITSTMSKTTVDSDKNGTMTTDINVNTVFTNTDTTCDILGTRMSMLNLYSAILGFTLYYILYPMIYFNSVSIGGLFIFPVLTIANAIWFKINRCGGNKSMFIWFGGFFIGFLVSLFVC